MSKGFSDIVVSISGPITQRTLENLRRHLEDLYVKSTAQGSSLEEQASFSPTLIAQAHRAAMEDNATTIITWATAIYRGMTYAQSHTSRIEELERYIASTREKIAWLEQVDLTFPYAANAEERERCKEATAHSLRDAQEKLSRFEKELDQQYLRDLRQSSPPVFGHSSCQGQGTTSLGHRELDGGLQNLPRADS